MPDPLTLAVMSQIVRKAGGKEEPKVSRDPWEAQPAGQPHLTDRQAVLLSELIHRKQTAARTGGSSPGTGSATKTESKVSLDDLVRSAKTR